jgi:hypothetical protein
MAPRKGRVKTISFCSFYILGSKESDTFVLNFSTLIIFEGGRGTQSPYFNCVARILLFLKSQHYQFVKYRMKQGINTMCEYTQIFISATSEGKCP